MSNFDVESKNLNIICDFITNSKCIQHLNLSHTHIEGNGMIEIIKSAKDDKCKSLQSLHLSGNLGLRALMSKYEVKYNNETGLFDDQLKIRDA